jgi:hypothetical protein
MTGSVAVMLGLSLMIVLMITVFILVRRKRRLSSPEARYQHDIRGLRTSTYLRTEPLSPRVNRVPTVGRTSTAAAHG